MMRNTPFRKPCLLTFLVLMSCIKAKDQSLDTSPLAGGESSSCELDAHLAGSLPPDCIEKIITHLPFREVLRLFPPSSPKLQALVKERVIHHWPRWFLAEIEKKGEPGRAGERLVMHYLAFLRLPAVLKNRTFASRVLDVQNIGPTSPNSFDKIVRSIEDRTLAIVDIKQQTLTLYDLENAKVLATARIPNRDYATMGSAEAQLVPLSKHTFLSSLRFYSAEPRTPLMDQVVWTWTKAGELKRLRILPPAKVTFPMTLLPDREQFQKTVIRSSDQSFVILDLAWNGDRSTGFRFDLVSSENGAILKSGLIPRESLPHYDAIRVEFGTYSRPDAERFQLTQNRQKALQEVFDQARAKGFDLDVSDLEHSNLFAMGTPVDQKTRLSIFDSSIMFFSQDYRNHTMLYRTSDGPIGGKSLLARFSNQDGDIVFSNGDQYVFANLWKSVMRVASDRTILESCQ